MIKGMSVYVSREYWLILATTEAAAACKYNDQQLTIPIVNDGRRYHICTI